MENFKNLAGILVLILAIPVLIIGFLKFGGIFIVKTAIATVIVSFSLTVTDAVFNFFYNMFSTLLGGF